MSSPTFIRRTGMLRPGLVLTKWIVLLSHAPAKDARTVTRFGVEAVLLMDGVKLALAEAKSQGLKWPFVEQVTRVYS